MVGRESNGVYAYSRYIIALCRNETLGNTFELNFKAMCRTCGLKQRLAKIGSSEYKHVRDM